MKRIISFMTLIALTMILIAPVVAQTQSETQIVEDIVATPEETAEVLPRAVTDAVPEVVLELTVSDVIIIVFGSLSFLVSLIVATWTWARTPDRSFSALDSSIQRRIDAQRANAEYMTSVEGIVEATQRGRREEILGIGNLILKAAQWFPGDADTSLGKFVVEAADGVPMKDKPTLTDAYGVVVQPGPVTTSGE